MTDQKSLKHLVRSRMARTGESYTTAHRHVSAPASGSAAEATRHAGVVAGYPGFGAEDHRPSAMARHLLAVAGVDISEPMACGLGGGVGFMYAVFEYKQVEHPLVTIVAQHHPTPWLSAVTENLGVGLDTQHSSSGPAARTKLDSRLEAGTPALVTVARGLLPHHPGGSEMEAAEPYQVVVAGRRGDDYFLDDLASTPQAVSGDELVAAWAAHRKGRFELITLVRDSVEELDLANALPVAIGRAVQLTVGHLTGPVLGNSFDVNFGISGMNKLAAELRDGTRKRGWARLFATPAHAAYAGSRLHQCLTDAYTAVGATRPLYARFLAEAAEMVDHPALVEAARLFGQSGKRWTALAADADSFATVLAGGERPVDVPLAFSAFADLVDECAALEEQAAGRIQEFLDG